MPMLTRNEIKRLATLKNARAIRQEQQFIAAGAKLITTLTDAGMQPLYLLTDTPDALSPTPRYPVHAIAPAALQRIVALDSPTHVAALFALPNKEPLPLEHHKTIILEQIQDPGNLGTIIRSADWFGFDQVICSPDSAFLYAPKALQATMGAAASVHVAYTPLLPLLASAPSNLPLIATTLDGTPAHALTFPHHFALLIGNEGHGLDPQTLERCTHRITIPKHGHPASESLNAAQAATILCYLSSTQNSAPQTATQK